jgi:hypothetical protein
MFNETSCQRGSTDQFDVDVRNGSAVFSFNMHFASKSEARQVTEPFIHAWQVQDGLEHSPGELCFIYRGADIVDRAPPPDAPRPAYVDASVTSMAASSMMANATVSRDYPLPPGGFMASEDVSARYHQHEGLIAGRMPLGTAAFFVHSLLEERGGGQQGASEMYGIDLKVLRKIGELTTTKGGKEARKAEGLKRPFSGSETRWLHAVIRALIKRVGRSRRRYEAHQSHHHVQPTFNRSLIGRRPTPAHLRFSSRNTRRCLRRKHH